MPLLFGGRGNGKCSSLFLGPSCGSKRAEEGVFLPLPQARRKAFGCHPEEESFAVSGQMGDVRWNQLAEKKGKNSEFQFSKERLFFLNKTFDYFLLSN